MEPDAEYWKGVAAWMGDIIAATAARQIDLKSVGVGEKGRQARIAEIAADTLEGRYMPTARNIDLVVKRLRDVRYPPLPLKALHDY